MLLQHQMSYLRRNLILKILNLLADIWVPLDYRPASFPSYKGSAASSEVSGGQETLGPQFSTIHTQAAKPRQGQRPCPLFSGQCISLINIQSQAYLLCTNVRMCSAWQATGEPQTLGPISSSESLLGVQPEPIHPWSCLRLKGDQELGQYDISLLSTSIIFSYQTWHASQTKTLRTFVFILST